MTWHQLFTADLTLLRPNLTDIQAITSCFQINNTFWHDVKNLGTKCHKGKFSDDKYHFTKSITFHFVFLMCYYFPFSFIFSSQEFYLKLCRILASDIISVLSKWLLWIHQQKSVAIKKIIWTCTLLCSRRTFHHTATKTRVILIGEII